MVTKIANDRVDADAAGVFLDSLGNFGEYSDVHPPTYWDYERYLRHKNSTSMPGPDGLPYSAWTSSGNHGVDTLTGVDQELRTGVCLHPERGEGGRYH